MREEGEESTHIVQVIPGLMRHDREDKLVQGMRGGGEHARLPRALSGS